MVLKIPGKWIWDFWFAQDGPDYHIFYLQADSSLEHETLRHWNVSVGHAVSQDLKHWQILVDAIKPSPSPAWDDKTTWTGSVINHDGLWYMFYTGASIPDEGLVQRIGIATSTDLVYWEKHQENPVIEADPQWYELLDRNLWHDQAWRDPYIYHEPKSGLFHAFITARANTGPADARGVIGHATSKDLFNWTVKPPITPSGEFGHMEVPQVLQINNRYYMIFSCPTTEYAKARRDRIKGQVTTGSFYLTSDKLTGPYTYETEGKLFADPHGSLYSGKMIQDLDGKWVFMAFRNFDWNDRFIGDIIDPIPVTISDDGRLTINDLT